MVFHHDFELVSSFSGERWWQEELGRPTCLRVGWWRLWFGLFSSLEGRTLARVEKIGNQITFPRGDRRDLELQ